MKTFLVTQKDKPVIINGKSYYYNNIITLKDNDTDTLNYCESLVVKGILSYYNISYAEIKPKKVTKPKKSKPNNKKEKVSDNKNKNNKKEEE